MSKFTNKKYLEKQRKKALKKEACKRKAKIVLEDGTVLEGVLIELLEKETIGTEYVSGHYRFRNGQQEWVRGHYRNRCR